MGTLRPHCAWSAAPWAARTLRLALRVVRLATAAVRRPRRGICIPKPTPKSQRSAALRIRSPLQRRGQQRYPAAAPQCSVPLERPLSDPRPGPRVLAIAPTPVSAAVRMRTDHATRQSYWKCPTWRVCCAGIPQGYEVQRLQAIELPVALVCLFVALRAGGEGLLAKVLRGSAAVARHRRRGLVRLLRVEHRKPSRAVCMPLPGPGQLVCGGSLMGSSTSRKPGCKSWAQGAVVASFESAEGIGGRERRGGEGGLITGSLKCGADCSIRSLGLRLVS